MGDLRHRWQGRCRWRGHYLVEWTPTLVPKYHLKNAKALVEKFEARLRVQGRQRDGTGRGKLPTSKLVQQGVMRPSITANGTQHKRPRGRPRKHV
jgi:hypothetical protein